MAMHALTLQIDACDCCLENDRAINCWRAGALQAFLRIMQRQSLPSNSSIKRRPVLLPVPDAIAEKAFAIFLDFVTAYAVVLAQVRTNERCIIEGSILRVEDYGDDRVHQ